MHIVSQWTGLHPAFARLLILVIELTNTTIGMVLGAALWAEFFPAQTTPAGYLQVGIILLTGAILYIKHWYYLNEAAEELSQLVKQRCTFALVTINFLLYSVSGGISAQRIQVFHPSGSVGGVSEIRYESATTQRCSLPSVTADRILRHKQVLNEKKPDLTVLLTVLNAIIN